MASVAPMTVSPLPAPAVHDQRATSPGVLILSTSLLTHRMLAHTAFFNTLRPAVAATVWTTGSPEWGFDGGEAPCVETFPAVRPFWEAYNYLRRLNEFAWDERLQIPSRRSIALHTRSYARSVRLLQAPARLLARAGLVDAFEDRLERLLLTSRRSPEAAERLARLAPSVLMTMGPF